MGSQHHPFQKIHEKPGRLGMNINKTSWGILPGKADSRSIHGVNTSEQECRQPPKASRFLWGSFFGRLSFPSWVGPSTRPKNPKETSSSLRYPGDSSSLSQLLGGWWIIPTCCNSRVVVVLSAFVGFADHSSQPGRTRRRRETYNFYPLSNSFKIRQKSQIPKDTTTHSWYFWFHFHVSTMCGNIIKRIFQIPVLTNEKTKFSLDWPCIGGKFSMFRSNSKPLTPSTIQ